MNTIKLFLTTYALRAALTLIAVLAITSCKQNLETKKAAVTLKTKVERIESLEAQVFAFNQSINVLKTEAKRSETNALETNKTVERLKLEASKRITKVKAAPVPKNCPDALEFIAEGVR